MNKWKKRLNMLESYIKLGATIKWQENQWIIFDDSGEGLFSAYTLYDLFKQLTK